MGILLAHCLHAAPEGEAERLRAILGKGTRQTTEDEVRQVFDRMRDCGSFAFALELIGESQRAIDKLCEGLGEPELVGILAGISDLFLAPLIAQVGE
jgi:hypothetical protein